VISEWTQKFVSVKRNIKTFLRNVHQGIIDVQNQDHIGNEVDVLDGFMNPPKRLRKMIQ